MRKLRLNPEHLAVESFPTAPRGDAAGTVRGLGFEDVPSDPVPTGDQTIISGDTCLTQCFQRTCLSCTEPSCDSCITACMTGKYPICCPA